jgi:predicted small secreted protein
MTSLNRIGLSALLVGASLLALSACNTAKVETGGAGAAGEVRATTYP